MKDKGLWNKNFTLITLGTIISAIAGQAMALPISLLVFNETKSTLLSGIMIAVGSIPSMILPIIIAPMIDNFPKKRTIVSLDYLMGIIYIIFGIIISKIEFNYLLFLGFQFITGILGSIYRLSFDAWYPDLIEKGFEQKGYAVSSMIYPSIVIFMAPISTILYERLGIVKIFYIVGLASLIAASFELFIDTDKYNYDNSDIKFGIDEYKKDIRLGIEFLKKEKGIFNIYLYMSITNAIGMATNLMTQAFFQTSIYLSERMYSFLKSSETLGRLFGGFIHYRVDIDREKRYGITKLVYIIYTLFDMVLLFLGFPFMLINRFICGILGVNSATLREASVQSYLPANMRAKINAVFATLIGFMNIIVQILVGILGEILEYRLVIIICGIINFIAIYILIIKPDSVNRKVYEVERN